MKSTFIAPLLCAASGIFLVAYLPYLPPIWLLLLFSILAVLFLYQRYFTYACLLLGVVYGSSYGHYLVAKQWPAQLNNQRFIIQGQVVNLPEKMIKQGKNGYRFHFVIDDLTLISDKNAPLNLEKLKGMKLTLSWQPQWGSASAAVPLLKTGDYWQLEVKLRRPRGFVNPAGFDYQLYLLQQNTMASGYVRKSQHNQWLGRQCHFYSMHCWRNSLFEKVQQVSHHLDHSGLLLGLLIGDKQGISNEEWDTLRNTGTVHLLAISGLHIGLAATLGLFFGRVCMRCWSFLFSFHNIYYLPSLFSLLLAGVYSLLSGFSLPTQRALIMVLVFHLFFLTYRKVSPWLLLITALFFVALLDPLSVRSQGFWLSFLAVALLLLSFSGYHLKNSGIHSFVFRFKRFCFSLSKAQWVMTIGLFLPSILLMQGLSLSSPLANIVAIPLVSFITVPLLFCVLFVLPFSIDISFFLLVLADASLEYLFLYLHFLQNNIGGFWYFGFGEIKTASVVLAVIGLLWFLFPRGFPRLWLGGLCFLPVFFPKQDDLLLRMTFLDVGQGTAIVVKTLNHQLVYDTGKYYSERFDSGKHIVAPYLLHLGHKEIDTLITSHGDGDHHGGTAGLMSLIKVKQHFSGEADKTGGQQCLAGQQWQWDQVRFSVLWPTADFVSQTEKQRKANDRSCVLLIEQGENRLLLTGDIEKTVEQYLLALYPEKLKSLNLVLVPHHGSKTSSHPAWVTYLQPRYAVVTAGYMNSYRHPHPKVVARYQRLNTILGETAKNGAVDIVIDSEGKWFIRRWRDWKKRYWYD